MGRRIAGITTAMFTGMASLVLGCLDPVQAASITLQTSRDVTLYDSPSGQIANGSGLQLFVGRTNQRAGADLRRAALYFDVAGALPAGAVVQSVSLRLRMYKGTTGAQTTTLHRILSDWGEGASSVPLGGRPGQGTLPQTGDATWIHRFYPDTFWAQPGGDFSPSPSAEAPVLGISFSTWNSTPQLVSDVQSWLDSPSMNFGWMVIGNETASRTAKSFTSRLHVSLHPQLTVEYYTTEAMAGTVNSGSGSVVDVLTVNGTSGGTDRRVRVSTGSPVTLALGAAPLSPSGRYVLWMWNSLPGTPIPLSVGMAQLGSLVHPIPPLGGNPLPTRCIRNPGFPASACNGITEVPSPSPRTPWSVTNPRGSSNPLTLTLQGIVEDAGAGNSTGFSVTNALVLSVE